MPKVSKSRSDSRTGDAEIALPIDLDELQVAVQQLLVVAAAYTNRVKANKRANENGVPPKPFEDVQSLKFLTSVLRAQEKFSNARYRRWKEAASAQLVSRLAAIYEQRKLPGFDEEAFHELVRAGCEESSIPVTAGQVKMLCLASAEITARGGAVESAHAAIGSLFAVSASSVRNYKKKSRAEQWRHTGARVFDASGTGPQAPIEYAIEACSPSNPALGQAMVRLMMHDSPEKPPM